MTEVATRRWFPVARHASLEHSSAGPTGSEEREWRAIVDSALRGGSCLEESLKGVCTDPEGTLDLWIERLRSSDWPVVLVPFRGRYHYDWVLVDLRAEGVSDDPSLLVAARMTDPRSRGLLIVRRTPPAGVPGHVDALTTSGPDGEPIHLLSFVQLARSILAYLPATRVYVTDMGSAAFVHDALDRHSIWIGRESEFPATGNRARGSKGSKRAPSDECRISVLRWLETQEALTPIGTVLGAVPGAERAVLASLDRTRARGGPMHAAAIARHLTPGAMVEVPIDLSYGVKPVGARTVDLNHRERRSTDHRAIFACMHLMGDLLNTTQSLREYRKRNPDAHVTMILPDLPYTRIMELSVDVDRIEYVTGRSTHQIIFESSTEHVRTLPAFQEPCGFRHVFDIQATPRLDERTGRVLHMAESYATALGYGLSSRRPILDLTALDACSIGGATQIPKEPYVVFARHTVSGSYFGPDHPSTKRWSERRWIELARRVRRESGLLPVTIGAPYEPFLSAPGVLDLHDLEIRETARLLRGARALVTIDNGIFHLGLAVGVPVVHLYPTWMNREWVCSCPEVPHRDLYEQMKRIRVGDVWSALRELLGQGRSSE